MVGMIMVHIYMCVCTVSNPTKGVMKKTKGQKGKRYTLFSKNPHKSQQRSPNHRSQDAGI